MPAAMNDCFKMFQNRQKTVFLLSGFKWEFVEEWADIYKSIVYFIAEMYTAYFIELNWKYRKIEKNTKYKRKKVYKLYRHIYSVSEYDHMPV